MPRVPKNVSAGELDDYLQYGDDERFERTSKYNHSCGIEVRGGRGPTWTPPSEEAEWREGISDQKEYDPELHDSNFWLMRSRYRGAP